MIRQLVGTWIVIFTYLFIYDKLNIQSCNFSFENMVLKGADNEQLSKLWEFQFRKCG